MGDVGEGLYDDDAVIRRIVREGWLLLGPLPCSIVLQIAHPSVARGVNEHSYFTERPLARARGTVQFVYALVFGTREEAEAVSRAARAMHASVVGPGYRADDPDLQLWVAATGFACYVDGHERLMGPLTAEERAAALHQFAAFATMLGCPPERWPATVADFDAYWERMLGELDTSPDARAVMGHLFRPTQWWLRPLTALQRFLVTGLLPEPVRARLGLPWGRGRQRAFTAALTVGSRLYPRLPLRLREWPKDYYLGDLRRRRRAAPAR